MKLTFMWTCTWSRCYAVAVGHVFKAGGWGGVGWDNNGSATHTSWYATVRCVGLPRVRHAMLLDVVLDFYIYVMLRYWLLSCTSTHTSCHAMFPWVSTHTSCYVIFIFFWTSTRTWCYPTEPCLGPPHISHATLCSLRPPHLRYLRFWCREQKTVEFFWKRISWGLWKILQTGSFA